jgi:hypothetical protein
VQKLSRIRSNSGSVLVFALVLGIVFSIIGLGTLRLVGAGSEMHYRDVEIIKSYWANEGALRLAFRYMSRVTSLPAANINNFIQGVSPVFSLNGKTPDAQIKAILTSSGTYVYSCSTTVSMSNVGLVNVTVCSSFTVNSMSRYTWFEENTSNTQWKGMIIHGDYHSNGYIRADPAMTPEVHVTGQATTSGRITSGSSDRPNYPSPYDVGFMIVGDNTNSVKDLSWFETRIPDYGITGTIPTDLLAPASASFANAYSITNTSNDSIAIKLNGASVDIWKRQNKKWNKTLTADVASISNGIIKSSSPTYVWGTLDGRLTIVTDNAKDIIIGSDIQYANSNLNTSNDVLALVSANDIVVPKATTNSTVGMTHDFSLNGATVSASLFMTNGGIAVQSYDSYSALRDLNVTGSVLLDQSMGTYTGSHGIRGQYFQDPRFVGNAVVAPGIPFARSADDELTGQFMWLLGNGTWKNSVRGLN